MSDQFLLYTNSFTPVVFVCFLNQINMCQLFVIISHIFRSSNANVLVHDCVENIG